MSGVKFSPGDKVWAAHDKEVYAIGRIKEKLDKEKSFIVFDEVSYKQWKAKEDEGLLFERREFLLKSTLQYSQ